MTPWRKIERGLEFLQDDKNNVLQATVDGQFLFSSIEEARRVVEASVSAYGESVSGVPDEAFEDMVLCGKSSKWQQRGGA